MLAFFWYCSNFLLERISKNDTNIEIQTCDISLKLIPVYLNIQRLYMRDLYLEIHLGDLLFSPDSVNHLHLTGPQFSSNINSPEKILILFKLGKIVATGGQGKPKR